MNAKPHFEKTSATMPFGKKIKKFLEFQRKFTRKLRFIKNKRILNGTAIKDISLFFQQK
jgi:hypothetical protein